MGSFNSLRCGHVPQLAPKIKHLRVSFSMRPLPAALDRAFFNALLEQFMEIGGILKLGAFQ